MLGYISVKSGLVILLIKNLNSFKLFKVNKKDLVISFTD
jgi:hypothetical protein